MLNLNIPEKLFVISIDDQRGRIPPSVRDMLCFGLAGAILAELSLAGRIQVQDGRVLLVDPAPVDEAFLDECLALITFEDIILLSLLKACGFLKPVFTRDERKYANKRIKTLVEGEIIGEAVATLIAEIETAMIVAVTTATLN